MSFQVKFGSQSNVSEDTGSKRGGRKPRPEPSGKTESEEQQHHRGRGRGRGERGRGRGERGRGQGEGGRGRGERGRGRGRRGYRKRRGEGGGGGNPVGDEEDEEDEGSDESDGGSSVTSEGRGGGRGGRWRGDGGRGRGGKRPQNGDNAAEPCEGVTSVPQPEVHIHYHHEPPPQHQMHPPPSYPPQQPVPPHPGYQPYPNQPGPPAAGYPYHYPYQPGPGQHPYPPGHQPYSPVYPPPQQPYGEPYPSQPGFGHAAQGPHPPARRPPLLSQPPQYSLETRQPHYQDERPGQDGRSAGPWRGSRQNLSQKPVKDSRQSDGYDKPEQRDDTKRGTQGQKPRNSETEQLQGKGRNKDKQEQPQNSDPNRSIPELSPDEWIKVFNLLLRQFNGRTKLGTLMSQKGDLFKGFSHADAAEWLKHSNRFLTFEKNGQVKYVSVSYKDARACFKYRKHKTDKCENENCPFFHICRDFIAGSCPQESSCHFNHSFHSKSNAKVCSEAGLQAFTDEEIRTIVFRSTPVVCSSFNKGGCHDDCPDLHVCSRYIRNDCSDEDCKLGHRIKGSDHNNWILETFHMQKIAENTLCKMAIAQKPEGTEASGGKKPSQAHDDSTDRAARDTRTQEKAPGLKKSRSKERLFDNPKMTLPPTPQQETTTTTAANKRQRKPKAKASSKEESSTSEMESYSKGTTHEGRAARQGEGLPLPHQETEGPGQDGGQSRSGQSQESKAAAREAGVLHGAEGGEGQRPSPASHYTHLCEHYTWSGTCSKGYLCPRFHHRLRPPYVWQLKVFGDWQDFSATDNEDIEKRFCALVQHEVYEVVLDNVGGLKLSLDFNTLTATVTDTYTSESALSRDQTLKVRRWSTPSYVEADSGAPFNIYTQWCWYQSSQSGNFQPFLPVGGVLGWVYVDGLTDASLPALLVYELVLEMGQIFHDG